MLLIPPGSIKNNNSSAFYTNAELFCILINVLKCVNIFLDEILEVNYEKSYKFIFISCNAFEHCVSSRFFGCSSLTSIEIPKSVTTIVNFAFCGCTNLKDVYYDGTQSEWNKINIGHSNEFLTNALLHCSSTPTPTPTPVPTPTPNPTPQPSTQNDTAAEQVSVAKPKSVNPKTVKAAKKAVSVEWKKVSGVSGYEIQVATDKKFKKNKKTVTIKKQKTTKTTVKKLKANKKYYVRIRTYKTVNGKKVYSTWSKVKSVKTK